MKKKLMALLMSGAMALSSFGGVASAADVVDLSDSGANIAVCYDAGC